MRRQKTEQYLKIEQEMDCSNNQGHRLVLSDLLYHYNTTVANYKFFGQVSGLVSGVIPGLIITAKPAIEAVINQQPTPPSDWTSAAGVAIGLVGLVGGLVLGDRIGLRLGLRTAEQNLTKNYAQVHN